MFLAAPLNNEIMQTPDDIFDVLINLGITALLPVFFWGGEEVKCCLSRQGCFLTAFTGSLAV